MHSRHDGHQFHRLARSRERSFPASLPAYRLHTDLVTVMGIGVGSERLVPAAACCALVAAPFLVVDFPPVTDLPQHVAQIRLFMEAMRDPTSGYTIQWFTPYSLVYGLLGAAWAVCRPAAAGRAATLVLVVLSVAAVHWLAARRNRPVAAAVLASVVVFNHTLYWGFLSFVVGWLPFIVWLELTTRNSAGPFGRADALRYCAAALLLYVSHALWFALGLLWLLLVSVTHRVPLASTVRRLVAVAPIVLAAAAWYPQLASAGFVSPPVWVQTPTGRLSFSWLINATLGGLNGPAESLMLLVLVGWIAGSLWLDGDGLRTLVDRDLLCAGVLCWTLALLLPDKYMNTIQFGARWMPAGAVLLLLAVPAPRMAPRLQPLFAMVAVSVFCLTTARAWKHFEERELSGLPEALAALPERPRVLGLDFVKQSSIIRERPFLQIFAYAQVLRGGSLNFSFAGFAPSLVVYREPLPVAWTIGLEWFAEQVRKEDLRHFDYALVNATDRGHAAFAAAMGLSRREDGPRWRLYRIAEQ